MTNITPSCDGGDRHEGVQRGRIQNEVGV